MEEVAKLRGEKGPDVLRLEALRSGHAYNYEIRVYRQDTLTIGASFNNAGEPVTARNDIQIWVPYDLISSDRPPAAKTIEQGQGFLEMRCTWLGSGKRGSLRRGRHPSIALAI